ncbi:Disease resistance protein CC-NBS-LRR class family [Prunus dulcis]|uniref:Disease resistance protein CC-NBS-LRR class family n=1 Tax=Prunus dulcis TaxID=3755 RepID=A0A5H2XNG7_PRUDU|nr:Disease resistance protein CC-NBS-LRR class family [Prunus dulcis]
MVIKETRDCAQSSAEAKYIAAASLACQAIWLRRIFQDMGECQPEATEIFGDNKSAIAIAKNPMFHSRTKHIVIKHHFLREVSTNKETKLKYYKTEEQIADILTKALPRPKFELL